MVKNINKGDIFITNLEPSFGSEQGKIRPALIIQNNLSNKYSPITIIAPITAKIFTKEFPTNVFLGKNKSKLSRDSTILLNQIRAIDKSRLGKRVSNLDLEIMREVDSAIKVSLDLY